MKFYIEASEMVIYKTMVEAEDYHDAQEKFWCVYSDLEPTDIKNATINFIGESQQ
jgi:hypothetical protein